MRVDFENPKQVENVVSDTVAKFSQLDILVNNAGYMGKKLGLADKNFYEDFQRVIQVNLMAATRVAQLSIPYLIKTKGVMINLASVVDRVAFPLIAYSVSKAGVSMLTKTLANSLGDSGVRVVTVAPGPVKTDLLDGIELDSYTLMNRVGAPIEVANTIIFLCSDKASFITGCEIDVDGGYITKFGGAFNHMQQKFP